MRTATRWSARRTLMRLQQAGMGPLTGGRQGRHLLIFDGSEVVLVRGALRDGLVTAGEHRERRGVRGLKGAIVVALRGQKGLSWKVFEGSKKKAHPQ